jgi:hypothetical protein
MTTAAVLPRTADSYLVKQIVKMGQQTVKIQLPNSNVPGVKG